MEYETIIYGASDDCLEIRGELYEEFGAYECGENEKEYIACSDGTLLLVVYDGEWKFQTKRVGSLFEKIICSVGEDGEHENFGKINPTSYSDIVCFRKGLKWIMFRNKVVIN